MSKKGNISKSKKEQIKRALADLLFDHKQDVKFYDDKPSAVHLVKLLEERYKYKTTRQTIAKYLKEGLDKYRQTPITADNDKIRDIREAMRVQKMIWNDSSMTPTNRTKAANAWRALHKQLMEYEEQLASTKIKLAEVSRPIYQIRFKPPNVLIKCPKCKHEWYHFESHEENKKKGKWKPLFEKTENQSSFDDFEEKKDEK